MVPKATLPVLALIVSTPFAPAGEPAPEFITPDQAKGGQFSGKVQSLLMHRDKDGDGDGTSGTVALTLNYQSPEVSGFSLGGQFVGSTRLFESGSMDAAASWLHNDEFHVLNEAWLAYDFGQLGWDGAEAKVGRQIVNYDFAPAYNIRQKDQSFEAAILKFEPVGGLRIDVGHLERFSSWSSRDARPDTAWQADFVDIGDRAGVSYDTNGMQFISAVYDGCAPWSFALYDFYGNDLYNTLGAKAAYTWDLGGNAGALTFRAHWANQRDVGRMDTDGLGPIDSNIYEAALDYTRGGLTLSTGIVSVTGDKFQTPFRTSFTIDTELLWYTEQFIGETDSWFLKAVYKRDQWLFYTMLVVDEHDDDTICSEIDGVVKYNFSDQCFTAVKAGYGHRHYNGKSNTGAIDLRWLVGWTF